MPGERETASLITLRARRTIRLRVGGCMHPCGHGGHRSLLEAGRANPRWQFRTGARQRPAHPRRARSQDRSRRSRTKSTGRVSNAILTANTALRPADGTASWIPYGGAVPDWTWRLRPALRLLFFFGKRLSTMRTARPDSGHVSSRPTGSLRRALNQRPVQRALNASVMSVFILARGAAAL